MDDDDTPPMTGKLKGGPKKMADVKPAKGGKMPAIKKESAGKEKGGLAAGLKAASKAKGKISAKIPHTKVSAHASVSKAPNLFKKQQKKIK